MAVLGGIMSKTYVTNPIEQSRKVLRISILTHHLRLLPLAPKSSKVQVKARARENRLVKGCIEQA